jgi:deoxyadenosine/deoxycytidine kinase
MNEKIIIHGNIGAGKSSILKKFEKFAAQNRFNVIVEPEGVWNNVKNVNGKSTMELMYEDASTFAFTVQLTCQLSRQAIVTRRDLVNICERDIWSGNEIFGMKLLEDGLLSRAQFDFVVEHVMERDEIVLNIYLDTPVAECMKRIEQRGNKHSISSEYIASLKKKYDEHEYDLVLDGMLDVDKNVEIFILFLKKFYINEGL